MSMMLPIARALLRSLGKNEWFITYTGRQVWVLHPKQEDIELRDIGHALGHICRFGGHTRDFYSVAQHSYHVQQIIAQRFSREVVAQIQEAGTKIGPDPFPWRVATKKELRTALMHDSTEAYLGDVIRPLKVCLPIYRYIESIWWDVIRTRWGLCERIPTLIKYADEIAFLTERRDLIHPHHAARPWKEDSHSRVQPDARRIIPLEPKQAESVFMSAASQVGIV